MTNLYYLLVSIILYNYYQFMDNTYCVSDERSVISWIVQVNSLWWTWLFNNLLRDLWSLLVRM